MKKTLLSILLVFALSLGTLIGCAPVADESDPTDTAAAVYTMDVNPGVRIFVDTEGKVITVEATNEDGEAIVKELDFKGVDFEVVTERIIDALTAAGFVKGDEGSILITLEKAEIEISERLNNKIEKAFEKHGKTVSVIEQNLEKLDREIEKELERLADKHHISKGKAHLIEMIREEFPELSEEELAGLNVNELRMLLEDATEDIKNRFEKFGEIVSEEYKSRKDAVLIALAALELDITDLARLPVIEVRATNRDGVMLYSVEIILDDMKHELLINAKTGEVLESESKEYEPFDPEAALKEFFGKHGIDCDSLKDYFESMKKPDGEKPEHQLTRGEILALVLDELDIPEESIRFTEVKLHTGRHDLVFRVVIETESDKYELVLEAFSGEIIKAELNGTPIEEEAE